VIKIGIIGYGYWGPNLVRNFAEVCGAELCAVCDLSPAKVSAVARRYPSLHTTLDHRTLLGDPSLDAIAIATPVSSHFELAMQALRAGKHVFLEKPMTETSEQAYRLLEEAEARDLILMVDHTFLYTPAVQKMRELVSAGELGEIYYYDSIRINLGLFQHDVNVIWDLAVHDLAISDYLLGSTPSAVSANGACPIPQSPESIAYLSLFYANGMIAHINVNWLAPVKVRQTLIGGSRKMIVFDDLVPSEKVKVYDRGVTISDDPDAVRQLRVGYRAGDVWAPQLPTTEALFAEAAHFVSCIRTGDRPVTDGRMGARIMELLEAATASLRRRGEPVEVRCRA
jgi:predicted dehydrogenase